MRPERMSILDHVITGCLSAAFIIAACALIHYDEAIRPALARLAQSASALGMALTAYPPLSEAARPSSSKSVRAAAARWSGTPS